MSLDAGSAPSPQPWCQLESDFDGTTARHRRDPGRRATYARSTATTGGSATARAQFVKDAAPSPTVAPGRRQRHPRRVARVFATPVVRAAGHRLAHAARRTAPSRSAAPYSSRSAERRVRSTSDVDVVPDRGPRATTRSATIGGVRVITDRATHDATRRWHYCANKAPGTSRRPATRVEPSPCDYVSTPARTAERPAGHRLRQRRHRLTACLVAARSTVYGRDWWVPGSAAQFVNDRTPVAHRRLRLGQPRYCWPSGGRRSRTPRS